MLKNKSSLEERITEKKQFVIKVLTYFLEKEGNELTLGDKVIIKNQVNEYIDNCFKFLGEFPIVPPSTYYLAYMCIKPFGFKIDFLDKFGKDTIKECTIYTNKIKQLKKIYGKDVKILY